MSRIEQALRRIVGHLHAGPHRFALVGGFAVSARTEPRFTRDVDLVVAVPGDAAAQSLVLDLGARGYTVIAAAEQLAAKRLATARLAVPDSHPGDLIVDLLFASSGVEEVPPLGARESSMSKLLPMAPHRRHPFRPREMNVDIAAHGTA